MNLIRATAAGRPVPVGPRTLLLSPPSLRGLATVMAYLEGRIPPPEDAPPGWLPDIAGEAAFAEYSTAAGAALLLYIATRNDHPDLTIEEAGKLVLEMDDDGISALVRTVFVRGSRPNPSSRPGKPPSSRPPGKGIESMDYARIFEAESVKRFPPQVLASMSMDQFENIYMGGNVEPEDVLSYDEVMAIYEAYRPKPQPDGE
jgi:hypothetical protein